jgi:hypothetical protein
VFLAIDSLALVVEWGRVQPRKAEQNPKNEKQTLHLRHKGSKTNGEMLLN